MLENAAQEEDAVEEEAPDWRMLSKFTKGLGSQAHGTPAEAFIPRRGEKDFEPVEALAPAQLKVLQESRQALFAALSAGVRGHSSRDHVRCIWTTSRSRDPYGNQLQDRPKVPPYVDGLAKGVLFSSIGRWNREQKRLELSSEELLYLIERGNVECWTAYDEARAYGSIPMSVQQSWAEIIGTDHLSLERYQVYAYLKRLGYIVLRKEHVDSIWHFQTQEAKQPAVQYLRSFLGRLHSFVCWPWVTLNQLLGKSWVTPANFSTGKHVAKLVSANCCLISNKVWCNYETIFNALRLIQSGSKISLPKNASTVSKNNEGYKVFYYVYRPNNRFPKSAPPPPDFQVCVIDSETMPIPDISITNNLLETVGVPMVRPNLKNVKELNPNLSTWRTVLLDTPNLFLSSVFFWKQPKNKPLRQNVFTKIKRGERNVLLAVVDHGIISFIKFIETDFGKSPLVGAQSSI